MLPTQTPVLAPIEHSPQQHLRGELALRNVDVEFLDGLDEGRTGFVVGAAEEGGEVGTQLNLEGGASVGALVLHLFLLPYAR